MLTRVQVGRRGDEGPVPGWRQDTGVVVIGVGVEAEVLVRGEARQSGRRGRLSLGSKEPLLSHTMIGHVFLELVQESFANAADRWHEGGRSCCYCSRLR